jgi:hypothetical protein
MPTLANLPDALNDLRDRIVHDGYAPGLVDRVARDWDLVPALLARKFEEKHQRTPDTYSAIKPADAQAQAVEYAKRRAEKTLDRFTGVSAVPAGKVFTTKDGETYVTVGLVGKGTKCQLHAVRVRDALQAKGYRIFQDDGFAVARRYNLF